MYINIALKFLEYISILTFLYQILCWMNGILDHITLNCWTKKLCFVITVFSLGFFFKILVQDIIDHSGICICKWEDWVPRVAVHVFTSESHVKVMTTFLQKQALWIRYLDSMWRTPIFSDEQRVCHSELHFLGDLEIGNRKWQTREN